MRRAAREPLPAAVVALAALGACAVVLPLVGLGSRVSWSQLPGLLSSPSAQAALSLSLRTTLASTAICAVLGVPLALVLARRWPGVRVGRVLAVLPMTMPPVVAGIALLATLGRRGLLGRQLEAWGVGIAFSTAAVVVAQVFVSMPFLVVTLEAALRSRDTGAEAVARTLGAGPWRVLARVTLPLVAPALARGTALALGRSLGEFGATIAFAGSKEGVTRTLPLAIYLERESDAPTSLALAVVLIIVSFLIVGATALRWDRLLRRAGAAVRKGAAERPGSPQQGAGPRGPGRSAGAAGPAAPAPGACEAAGARRGQELRVSCTLPERGVSASVVAGPGRITALLGPNGSGKSTLCAVAAGLLDARGGEVRLGARVLDGPGAFVAAGRRDVALLSQDPGLFTHMSVLDNVAFGPRCQGLSRARARRRALAELAAVGAEHLAHRRGHELSGGQAARVALARALATGPGALVLDEPLAALDAPSRQEMRRLVARRAQEEGLTIVLVTHDVLDVAALADDIVVLERGRVVERGAAAELLSHPGSEFMARLVGTTVLTGTLRGTRQAPAVEVGAGLIIHGRPMQEGGPCGQEDVPVGDALPPGRPGAALIPPDAVALYRDAPRGSPRNVVEGRVIGMERAGALVVVELGIGAGHALRATVTAGAVASLGIEAGMVLHAVVKAVEVRILPLRPDPRPPGAPRAEHEQEERA
ncbi:ABC transporter permease [Actinomyces bowdenii]|uniref:ABC transporter permease n=1 Tax=Actinomyces bowdenii TaxID=131109 RepID=UPI001FD3A8AB|nr:ABC transporter permease [Actinomyces bowdenii]